MFKFQKISPLTLKSPGFKPQFAGYIPSNAHPQQVVAIKMITDRSAFRKDEQLAFAREMKVLTQVSKDGKLGGRGLFRKKRKTLGTRI
jgi:hypothetical protein